MGINLNKWITGEVIKAFFDRLEKQPIRVEGLDKTRVLVIWAENGDKTPQKTLN
jgi:hypothetical protein